MADFVGAQKKWPKNRRPGGQKFIREDLFNRSNWSQLFRKHDNNHFLKFQALVTSITGKVIDVSAKYFVLR